MFRKPFGPYHGPGPEEMEELSSWRRRLRKHFERSVPHPPFDPQEDMMFWFGPRGRGPFGPFFGRGGPFGGDPFDEDGGGGGRRHRRGDIKYLMLELLAEQPRHGYDLMQ